MSFRESVEGACLTGIINPERIHVDKYSPSKLLFL